jgi:hypothetical protein
MFTLLISVLGFLLPTSAESIEYQLTAFPVQEEMPTYTIIDSLPLIPALLALKTPKVEIIMPQVQIIAPKAPFAPAAAPEKALVVNDMGLPVLATIPDLPSAQQRRDARVPRELFSGKYFHYRKNNFRLSFKDTKKGPINLMFIELSPGQQQLMKNNEADPLVIERATGSLLLYGGSKKGDFDFLANRSYRESLNASGWGDAAAPENSIVIVTMGRLTQKELKAGGRRKIERPHDQLWFRYFINDINDAYIDLLRRSGYSDADLGSLWKLADAAFPYEKFEKLIELSSAVFTDTPNLDALAKMRGDLEELEKMKRRGDRMTSAEFYGRNARPLIGALGTPNTIFSDSITRVFGAPVIDRELPDNWGTGTPGRTASDLDVAALSKLVVKGNIRLYLNYSDTPRKIIVFASAAASSALKAKQSGNKLKLTNTHPTELIDIEVSGHQLESIRTSGNALFFKGSPRRE